MSDALEMMLRDSVSRSVEPPVDAGHLLQVVLARRRAARRPTSHVVMIAGILALLLIPIALLLNADHNPAKEKLAATGKPAPPAGPSPAAAPVGTQPVTWHGVQLYVPATWKLDDARFGTPLSNTVLRPGPICAALFASHRG